LPRLLVIGFDGMESSLARGWAQEGRLPHLKALLEKGASAPIVHGPEIVSGNVWPTLLTGFPPHVHDVHFFSRILPGTYRTRLGSSGDCKKDPFWAPFARQGREIRVFDVPFSWPDPSLGGVQVYGYCLHDWTWPPSSVPPDRLRKVRRKWGRHPIAACHDFTSEPDSLVALRDGLLRGIERKTEFLLEELRTDPGDIFCTSFSEAHCMGHLSYHLASESHPDFSAEARRRAGNPLLDVYRALDEALGRMVEAWGKERVAIFFSHGMDLPYNADHLFPEILARFHRHLDGEEIVPSVVASPGGGSVADRLWRNTVGLLPGSLRNQAKRLLPISLRGRISQLRTNDVKKRARARAFTIPQDGFSSLRLNLRGREPEGKLDPGREALFYLDALCNELHALRCTKTGAEVLSRTFRLDEVADPMKPGGGPDLLVWWRNDRPLTQVTSPTLGTIVGRGASVRTAEHTMRGLLVVSAPEAASARKGVTLDTLDVAPILCDLGGVEPPRDLPRTSRLDELLPASGAEAVRS